MCDEQMTTKPQQGVCHTCGLCHIYTFQKYLKAKEEEEEELWKLKYNFTMQKLLLIFKKKSSKRNQKNPSRYYYYYYYYNSIITNLKFQHKPKYHVSKILI
jgi:hypothetical protein